MYIAKPGVEVGGTKLSDERTETILVEQYELRPSLALELYTWANGQSWISIHLS